jgi:AcrR family transcriptional regulator
MTSGAGKKALMRVQARVKDRQLIGEKRGKIVQGAINVFKRKGYHKATVREIAEEAKIGLGSIYDYVKAKDDILYLFFENYVTNFFDKVKSMTYGDAQPLERLEMTYRAFVEAAMELEDQVMLSYTQAKYVKKHYLRTILHKESEIVDYFKEILDEALGPSTNIDTYMEANFLVYSGVFGVLRRWILKPHYDRNQIIDYLVSRQVGELIKRIRTEDQDGRGGQ